MYVILFCRFVRDMPQSRALSEFRTVVGSCHYGETKTFGYSHFDKANNTAESANTEKLCLRELDTDLEIWLPGI